MIKRKYIYNYNPKFSPPEHIKNRSKYIMNAITHVKSIDVARNIINKIIIPLNPITGNITFRFRRLNEHRARAMRAMVQAMLYYLNVHSNLVRASIEQLSDVCGLSTISDSGNKSITRASRLITDFMEPMGFIKCIKKSSIFTKERFKKKIFLTPLFFVLCELN
ncbi:plasmid replication initiator RepA (plasmid) [Buchnera aphidicola (Mollitrichosiphum nigrofasciatum)]|uniref:plasmid replication initiator RepA n=1 Tax=Buchnera aphidicola TaxID=9 RepID=UPI0031B86F07